MGRNYSMYQLVNMAKAKSEEKREKRKDKWVNVAMNQFGNVAMGG
jgi:hypothetical protein